MSARSPLAWRTRFVVPSLYLEFLDPQGTVRGAATLAALTERPPEPAPKPVPEPVQTNTPTSILDTLNSGLSKVATGLSGVGHNLLRHTWTAGGGYLPVGESAVLAMPDRTSGTVTNGSAEGYRRSRRTGVVEFGGRLYTLRHTSRRRTTVLREVTGSSREIAVLRRTGIYWRAHRADQPPRCRILRQGQLDLGDELAVIIAATMCGPAGRPGAISEFVNAF